MSQPRALSLFIRLFQFVISSFTPISNLVILYKEKIVNNSDFAIFHMGHTGNSHKGSPRSLLVGLFVVFILIVFSKEYFFI